MNTKNEQQDNQPSKHWKQQCDQIFDDQKEAQINSERLLASMDLLRNAVREPGQP